MEIRTYENSDHGEVAEILKLGKLYWNNSDNEKSLNRKIKKDGESILVAVEDGKVVGTIFIVDDFMQMMFRLAVHPDYRSKGIGKSLVKAGEEILKKRGRENVNILVNLDNSGLQDYYGKQGYEKTRSYKWMNKKI